MKLSEKITKQFLWTKNGWVLRSPNNLCHGCGDEDYLTFNHNKEAMDVIEDVRDRGIYSTNSQAKFECYQRGIMIKHKKLKAGHQIPTGYCFEHAVTKMFPGDSYKGYTERNTKSSLK